ncbi:hypothetical protein H0H81_006660 [Sphagnurus paluster]|uniref:Uncharacterized protein n=1 Tax=Sphagnurus paluster TaxID=117069 RepID=A0A9P7FRH7_9AGAR|nr:hypothetical protein H0H81_006660 [Sphagnurus paluster]
MAAFSSEDKKRLRNLLPSDLSIQSTSNTPETPRTPRTPRRFPSKTSTFLRQIIDSEKATVPETLEDNRNPFEPLESPREYGSDAGKSESSSRAATPEPTLKRLSQARWDKLRQHVLRIPGRPATPPSPLDLPVTAQTLPLPPRSQTPKPSRLARLGFRQVVDQVREVDGSRKFAQEIDKVCWSIRSAEATKPKADTNSPGPGSSLHLTFMSNTSLSSTITPSTEGREPRGPGIRIPELRRPQSILSGLSSRPTRSVKLLHQTLLQYVPRTSDGRPPPPSLPRETMILSTLLTPFLSLKSENQLEEERWSAIEAFEMVIRTWVPANEGISIERYIWCCKAASVSPPRMQMRVLTTLRDLLVPMETNYSVTTPECFQTLVQSLLSLLPNLRPLSTSAEDQEAMSILMGIISQVHAGCCGELEMTFIQEEYEAMASSQDDKNLIRGTIFLEALSRCLEECNHDSCLWLFQNLLEKFWISSKEFTPLLSAIHTRTLLSLSHALLALLSIPLDQSAYLRRARCAAQIVQERFIPDMDALGDSVKMDARVNIVNVVLELTCMDRAKDATRWGVGLLNRWSNKASGWKVCLDKALEELISKGNWSNTVIKIGSLVRLLPEEIRKPMVAFVLPIIYDKLVEEPPPYPCIPLTNLFDTVAKLYPQTFYKPLFLCAASSKEFTVVNHLCVIVIVTKFLPDFWVRDAEMMSVALMSEGGKKASEADAKSWTKARLGQEVIMLELIGCVQTARHEKETLAKADAALVETIKFMMTLEARLTILLEARERTGMIAPSQRLLFCILFREMRLLTRSLKPAPWLVRVIDWLSDASTDDGFAEEAEVEERSTIGQIQGLYAAALDGINSTGQRRSTMFLSKSMRKVQIKDEASKETSANISDLFAHKESLLKSLSKGFVSKAMKVLVTMSTLLTPNEYRRLGPFLWEQLQDGEDASLTAATCFLIMQCAEKNPLNLMAILEVDLQSSNVNTRLEAIKKIGILFNWRHQIITQHVVADRARRPFKLARGPLAFVATDIGSNSYVRRDEPTELNLNLNNSLPQELKRRLAEIGWDQGDEPVDHYREWVKMPISLMSTQQIDLLENMGTDLPPLAGTNITPDKVDESGLLRRNSSTGGPLYGVKRRPVFVPSLGLIFPRLASLVFDPDLAISTTARNTLIDIMRNDPTVISRPALDLFAGEHRDLKSALLTLKAFLHIQPVLPYPMTHILFNNIAGFLKWETRQCELEEMNALGDFASTIPVLARLAAQVSDISIRDVRRAKIEPFLIPSGSLWFPPSAPTGPMFPRGFESWNAFEVVPSNLVSMTMIRVSQNMLLLAILKRNRQDVQLLRKSMSRLELPSTKSSTSEPPPLELVDFLPRRQVKEGNSTLIGLSLMLSRSYVLLITQIIRSTSRHLHDRNELAILVDGLNRILLAHGDDIGIVSQVMIGECFVQMRPRNLLITCAPALMAASTRFRRLFTSGGYALFMPAVLKVYTESEAHTGIRLAIEYAVNRFYALHREAFIFQTLDILSHITALPNKEANDLAKSIYNLFLTLQKGILPSTPDAAAIHNANKPQEREALIVSTAEEKPQTFLSLLRRGPDAQGQEHIRIDLPEEYESTRLTVDDFIRLFLTVIAHDPTIVRAEQFLRILRMIAPELYNASSSARAVLLEGINALGVVLLRTKSHETPPIERVQGSSGTLLEDRLVEKSRAASNVTHMRLDYLALMVAFTRAGGSMPQATMLRANELIKTMLKEVPMDMNNGISIFMKDFIRTSFLREGPPSYKIVVAFLQDMSPLISNYALVVDFSGAFQAIAELVEIPSYSREPPFVEAVLTCVCAPALASCETAANENSLLTLPSRLNIVALLSQLIILRGAEVIAEIEKRTPSYDFLAGVVLPLVTSLKTESQLGQDGTRPGEVAQRNHLKNSWVRLLSFAMASCKPRRPLERSRSQDKRRSNDIKRSLLPPFLMALQITKVIVVRAEHELSSRLPGIWPRLGAFLIKVLAEGSASFATAAPEDNSPAPSPPPSPLLSPQFDPFSFSASTNFSPTSPNIRTFANPRMIDYALWSMLELLCVHRSPLVLQMRFFLIGKLVDLDRSLRVKQGFNTPSDISNRRASSSVFSKPRRRLSGQLSPHLPGSPRLSASQTFPQDASFHSSPSLDPGRQAGYNITSSPRDTQGPTIVHLGPISAFSAFGRALSPGRGGKDDGAHALAKVAKIRSPALVRATYRRIRTVQRSMGYDALLLPMPLSQEMDADEVVMTTWTRREALDAIEQETKDLLREFEDPHGNFDDDGVVVDNFALAI